MSPVSSHPTPKSVEKSETQTRISYVRERIQRQTPPPFHQTETPSEPLFSRHNPPFASHQPSQLGHGQTSSFFGGRTAVVQTKLSVSTPNDPYEIEAERTADAVMRMPATVTPPVEHPLQRQASRQALARRHSAELQPPAVTPAIESQIQRMSGGGKPLPAGEQRFFEERMGADFSAVRIHTDSNAVQTSRDLNARAFTVGPNIAFAGGEYQPHVESGRHLLAHELTHVIQQGGAGKVQRQVDNENNQAVMETAVAAGGAPQMDATAEAKAVNPQAEEVVDVQAMAPDQSAEQVTTQLENTPLPTMESVYGTETTLPAVAPASVETEMETTELDASTQEADKLFDDFLQTREQILNGRQAHNQQTQAQLQAAMAETNARLEALATSQPASQAVSQATQEAIQTMPNDSATSALPTIQREPFKTGIPNYQTDNTTLLTHQNPAMGRLKSFYLQPIFDRFKTAQLQKIEGLRTFSSTIRPALQSKAQTAKQAIDTATNPQITQLQSLIAGAKNGANQAFQVTEIETAKTNLLTAFTDAENALQNSNTQRIGAPILRDYHDAYDWVDSTIGSCNAILNNTKSKGIQKAREIANRRKKAYETEPLPTQNAWQRAFDGANYHQRRRQAKIDTAEEMGNAYAKAFADETQNGLDQLQIQSQELKLKLSISIFGLAGYYSSIVIGYRKAIADQRTSSLAAVDDLLNKIKGAQQQSNNLFHTLEGTLQQVRDFVKERKATIDVLADQAATELEQEVTAVMNALTQDLQEMEADFNTTEGINPQKLQSDLDASAAEIDTAIQSTKSNAQQALDFAKNKIQTCQTGTTDVVKKQEDVLKGNVETIKNEFTSKLRQLKTDGVDFLKKSEEATRNAITKATADLAGIAKQAIADGGVTEQLVKSPVKDKLMEYSQKFSQELDGRFQTSLAELDQKIDEKATEAADEIQPAWKEWVKILVSVVVGIVTALATAALLATGLGAIALLIGAALIGGLAGIIEKGLHDAIDGQASSFEDYAKAFGKGAIANSIGAVAGSASGTAIKEIFRQSKVLIRWGAELLSEGSINVASGMIGEASVNGGSLEDPAWKHFLGGFLAAKGTVGILKIWKKVRAPKVEGPTYHSSPVTGKLNIPIGMNVSIVNVGG